MLILQAAREIVEQEGFNEQLDLVCRRIDEIEGLRRIRELKVRPFISRHLIFLVLRQIVVRG